MSKYRVMCRQLLLKIELNNRGTVKKYISPVFGNISIFSPYNNATFP